MWGCVDEVGVGYQGGGEADGGAVESGYEDLRVGVEGVGVVQVVSDEGGSELFAGRGGVFVIGAWAGGGDIGASIDCWLVYDRNENGGIVR